MWDVCELKSQESCSFFVKILKYHFILCETVSELHLSSRTIYLDGSIQRGGNHSSGNVDSSSCERRVSLFRIK